MYVFESDGSYLAVTRIYPNDRPLQRMLGRHCEVDDIETVLSEKASKKLEIF